MSNRKAVSAPVESPVERARKYLNFDPKVRATSLADLRNLVTQTRAQTDQTATAIRAEMSAVLARIADVNARMQAPALLIAGYPQETQAMAERLFNARNLRQQLKQQQTDLSARRLAALGQRSKRLKAAGDAASADEVSAVEQLKATFAAEQEVLSAKIAANRIELDGIDKADRYERGLEHEFLWDVGGLCSMEEATEKRDAVMSAVSTLFELHATEQTLRDRLEGVLRGYERRLNKLV